jgi:mRNA interferase YafQ
VRTVKYTSRFRRDYRREQSGRHSKTLDADLMAAVELLAADRPLPGRYFDHPLAGEWKDHRDCHIKPDLLLIYRKPDAAASSWCVSARVASLVFKPSPFIRRIEAACVA